MQDAAAIMLRRKRNRVMVATELGEVRPPGVPPGALVGPRVQLAVRAP